MSSSSKKAATDSLTREHIREILGGVKLPGDPEDFSHSLHRPKQSVLRMRRGIDPQELPLNTLPIPWYELGHRSTDPARKPSRLLAFAAADFYLQDAGSLLALAAADADTTALRSLLVCDLCAAPGGKASALLEALGIDEAGNGGFLLANEPIRSRIGALQFNLAREGSDRFAISNLDPDALAERLPGVFDLVLVDAPCSGQALLGRGKQKTSALSSKQIQHSASRQQRILDAATRLLRDGGRLIYSTCTFAEAENETQVQRLVESGVAEPEPVSRLAPYESSFPPLGASSGCYRLWPHLHGCAGSFAASMRVRGGQPVSPKMREQRRSRAAKSELDLTDWYELDRDETRLSTLESVLFGWPADAPPWTDQIAVGGPELAHRAGKTWKPSHAGALRRESRARCRRVVEVDDLVAQQFMGGEPIPCEEDGWQIVQWRGRPLGWIKGHRNVGKNHLPSGARMPGELAS